MGLSPRFTSVLVVLLSAILLGRFLVKGPAELAPLVRGKNGKAVVFFTLAESGQLNVQLATAQALVEEHPDVEVHFASFSLVRDKIERVSSFARKRNPAVREFVYHEMPGPDRISSLWRGMNCTGTLECLGHPPGAAGAELLALQLELALWSWTGDEHLAIYQRAIDIVQEVDPAVAVVDYAFRPPLDALASINHNHLVITPLAAADIISMDQPYMQGLWKYPAWGTGFSFPVPWRQIPENIYVNFRLLYNILTHPHTRETIKVLKERGISANGLSIPRPDVPFITQTLPEASVPVFIPEAVTCAGAILLETAPAVEQDAELVEWVGNAHTVVINLGSLFKYSEERAFTMAQAVQSLLENTQVQVLWKVAKEYDFADDFTRHLSSYIAQDRLRIMSWFTVDTLSLLQLENVVASVHHGGSSSFNEATVAGVPQVVIPMWEDLYNFAQLAEDLGIGIYATRGTAPNWTIAGIVEPILQVLDQGEVGEKTRLEAKRIGDIVRPKPGRHIAAREVAKLME
ncbi:UDP-glucoronosyl and UDP-glucosyl transferase family protein [Xylariales sp. PMI_506]|nr:UDP-glucoronosyl and UDP-glucosyl transferase family protein [Xylariales sp. PMI_506]